VIATGSTAPAYLDSCVVLSLFLGDSGYGAAEQWLLAQADQPLWVSHWVLLEFSGVVALCLRRGELTAERGLAINAEFECFRQERLSLLEPRGADYLQARQWLQEFNGPSLRSGDALHLAMAKRQSLKIVSADQGLIKAAEDLGIAFQLIT
jgi:predicted nucleic acid-binding protein